MGAQTVLFTTSASKVADGKRLGADDVVLSNQKDAMKKHASSFDLIIDTVAADHDVLPYMMSLKRDAAMVMVGAPDKPLTMPVFPLLVGRRSFAGSAIGGLAETQEMMDFCAEHGVVSDIEVIGIQDINTAYERLLKNDVRYRFVIDMASRKSAA